MGFSLHILQKVLKNGLVSEKIYFIFFHFYGGGVSRLKSGIFFYFFNPSLTEPSKKSSKNLRCNSDLTDTPIERLVWEWTKWEFSPLKRRLLCFVCPGVQIWCQDAEMHTTHRVISSSMSQKVNLITPHFESINSYFICEILIEGFLGSWNRKKGKDQIWLGGLEQNKKSSHIVY